MAVMGVLKLIKDALAGGASKRVSVTLALPLLHEAPQTTLPTGPLQELRVNAAAMRRNRSEKKLRFIEHPMLFGRRFHRERPRVRDCQ